jgi:hypothetical protein
MSRERNIWYNGHRSGIKESIELVEQLKRRYIASSSHGHIVCAVIEETLSATIDGLRQLEGLDRGTDQ